MKRKTKNAQRTTKPRPSGIEELLFAGFGGQGIMFLGKLFAEAGLAMGKNVTWMPSYGAEVRGGTAYSMAKISSSDIASPVVTDPDILVAMNKPSLLKYAPRVKPGGVLISNKSLIDESCSRRDIKVVNIPMTDIAAKIGNTKCANMVAAGALAKRSKTVSMRYVLAALKEMLKGRDDVFAMNKAAFEAGYKI